MAASLNMASTRRAAGIAVLVLAALAGGCGRSRDGTDGTALHSRLMACRADQLHARGLYQRSMGNVFGTIILSNTTDGTCFVNGGRPQILVTAGGRRVQIHKGGAQLNGIVSPRRIVLLPGELPFDRERGSRGTGFYLEWLPACISEREPLRVRVRLPAVPGSVAISGSPGRPGCPYGTGVRVPAAYRRSGMVVSRLAPRLERAAAPF
jgi:hypothetical protein